MGLLDRLKSGKIKDHDKQEEKRNKGQQQEDYKPPSGPPPAYSGSQASSSYPQQTKADLATTPTIQEPEYAPPPGPPPAYHNWQSIPDTSLLPPPPSIGNNTSSTSNADTYLAESAWNWTDAHPPFRPEQPHINLVNAVRNGDLSVRAPEHIERGEIMTRRGPLSYLNTTSVSKDHCYLSTLPLYFEQVDSPFRTEASKIIYYEIQINTFKKLHDSSDSSVAIGYCVAPYPTWRMPGWQRGSLAIHSDDGARYMSHDAGGSDFTSPFKVGETVGLGIRFSIPLWRPEYATIDLTGQPLTAEVFFTRNGKFSGGWNIQEGLDQDEAWRADFLDGKWDVYAAVGTYGEVEVSINFGGQKFEYDPSTFTGI